VLRVCVRERVYDAFLVFKVREDNYLQILYLSLKDSTMALCKDREVERLREGRE
jgi:hypothetical protein